VCAVRLVSKMQREGNLIREAMLLYWMGANFQLSWLSTDCVGIVQTAEVGMVKWKLGCFVALKR